MKRRLGCLAPGGLVAAGLTLGLLAAVLLLWGGSPFSPGPLSAQAGTEPLGGVRSHAEIGGHCSACHPAPWSSQTMSDRCLSCHEDLGRQFQEGTGLHAALAAVGPVVPCYDCHGEHQGADGPLTSVDADVFPHQATGFSLQAHRQRREGVEFGCGDCHGEDLARFDQGVCARCHGEVDGAFMQAHVGAFGDGCLACHDGVDRYGTAFDHGGLAFPLDGAHTEVDCAGCHPGARSPADLQAAPQDCYACHEEDDAHGGELGEDCAACHTPQSWEEASFDHAQTAFPLEGAHRDAACQACHEGGAFAGTPQDCYACHEEDDAHEGELGEDCAGCHTPEVWEEASFDHAQTAFPLEGAHRDAACQACHEGGTFAGTPQDCYACHEEDDAHGGELGQDCAACHTPEVWEEASFDHAQTAFPLEGAHRDAACQGCHEGGTFAGTPQECYACHEEPAYHAGLLGTDCAACHDAAGWTPARFDEPHLFPVNHGEAGASPCRTCHPDRMEAYTCYGCHEHDQAEVEREHREEGISDFQDCVECHPTGREEEGENRDGDGDD